MTDIVILGGGGFIGGHICRAAGTDIDMFAPSSSELDLTDATAVAETLCPRIGGSLTIFSAGIHRQHSDTFETLIANQRMIDNLCTAFASAPPSSVVFLSSVEVYGAPRNLPVTEETPLNPLYRYAVGKAACELLLLRTCQQLDIPLTIFRLPGIYGPRDNGTSILSKLVASATGGPVFQLFGDGDSRRDYVHADDVAWATLEAGRRRLGGTVNLATGTNHSLNELIAEVSTTIGPCRTEPASASGKEFDLAFDTRNLMSMLPDFAPMTVKAGLESYLGTPS